MLYPALFALCSLFSSASALPFFPHLLQRDTTLVPRASYSVVPVDGGSPTAGAANQPQATVTVIQTVVSPSTQLVPHTIVETDIVPAGTATVFATTTVIGDATLETVVVTALPPATTVVVPSIVYVATPLTETLMVTTTTSATTTATPKTTPRPVYDDGMWHTTYPVWTNSSNPTAAAKKP